MSNMTDGQKLDYLIEEQRSLRHYVAEEIGHMRMMINALEIRMTEFARHDFQLSCRVDKVSERLSTLEETFKVEDGPVREIPASLVEKDDSVFNYVCPGPTIPELALVEAVLDLNENHNLSDAYSHLYMHMARIVDKGDELTPEFVESHMMPPYKAYFESCILMGSVVPPDDPQDKHRVALFDAFKGNNCDNSSNLARSYIDAMHFFCGSCCRLLMENKLTLQGFREKLVEKANLYKEATNSMSTLRERADRTFRKEGKLK